MAATGNDAGAPDRGCGSHTATGVPDDARGNLYLYIGGSSGTCNGIDIVRIKHGGPDADAKFLSRADGTAAPARSCHDNNVLMGVNGGTQATRCAPAATASPLYKFDMAKPPTRPARRQPGRRREPDAAVVEADAGVTHRPLRLVHLRRQAACLRP